MEDQLKSMKALLDTIEKKWHLLSDVSIVTIDVAIVNII